MVDLDKKLDWLGITDDMAAKFESFVNKETGEGQAGVKVIKEDGTSFLGTTWKAGDIIVYGRTVTAAHLKDNNNVTFVDSTNQTLEYTINSFSVSNVEPKVGDTITFTVNVENTGNISSDYPISLYKDDEIEKEKTVNLSPGNSKDIKFDYTVQQSDHSPGFEVNDYNKIISIAPIPNEDELIDLW